MEGAEEAKETQDEDEETISDRRDNSGGQQNNTIIEGLLYTADIEAGLLSRLSVRAANEASELAWVRLAKRLVGTGFVYSVLGGAFVVLLQFRNDIESSITPFGIGTFETLTRIAVVGLIIIIVLLLFLKQIDEGTHPFKDANSEWVTPVFSLSVGFVLLTASGILFFEAGMDLVIMTAIGMLLSGALLAGSALLTLGVYQLREVLGDTDN